MTDHESSSGVADYCYKFSKCKDTRNHEITGLWERNGRYYGQIEVPGKGTRRVPLRDENDEPVKTLAAAKKALSELRSKRDRGQMPGPRITPCFNEYVKHYVSWLTDTSAKSPLTVRKERGALLGWAEFLGALRLNAITPSHINEYARERAKDGLSTRAINLDVIALSNLLKLAKREGWLKYDLPTDSWEPLKYTAPRRELLTWNQIEAVCTEAVSLQEDGKPKYKNGQFLSDYIKLLAFSGARRQAGLSAKWSQVDWDNRQITLFTKFDKRVVVDFNERLEAHLRDMWARRNENSPWMFPTAGYELKEHEEGEWGYFANPQKVLNSVCKAAGLPDFHLHDLRHYFASYCVMSGVDVLTVARWLGHADGGVLIGKVYGHLDPKHCRDSAAKVSFTPKAQQPVEQPATLPELDLSSIPAEVLLAALQKRMVCQKN